MDIQDMARDLSSRGLYPESCMGLKHTVRHFLGFSPPKGSQVTMGDWEAAGLSDAQINYAVLDALYVGEVFRKMRHIHSDRPHACY